MSDINESHTRETWAKAEREEAHEEREFLSGLTGFESFYYNAQIRKYIVQMAAVFSGLKVRVGWRDDKQPRLVPVPIKNASMDRIVASIKGENTQNVPIRLPIMSIHLESLELAPERRHGVGQKRRNTFMPTGGSFPDDISVVDQRMPIPYRGMFNLGIWVSNQEQHYQIVEQILTLFDPTLQIQKSDEVFDWTMLSYVELIGLNFEENIPSGTERRVIQSSFQFQTDMYLEIPSIVHDKLVREVFVRIGMASNDSKSSYDVISDLDAQGAEYEKWYDLDYTKIDRDDDINSEK